MLLEDPCPCGLNKHSMGINAEAERLVPSYYIFRGNGDLGKYGSNRGGRSSQIQQAGLANELGMEFEGNREINTSSQFLARASEEEKQVNG